MDHSGTDPCAAVAYRGELVHAVAQHTVGNQPERLEPRTRNRRPKRWQRLKVRLPIAGRQVGQYG